MDTTDPPTDEDLADIEERVNAATPGPWRVRFLDDDAAMNLTAASTAPDTGLGERWPGFDAEQIVAAYLVGARTPLTVGAYGGCVTNVDQKGDVR